MIFRTPYFAILALNLHVDWFLCKQRSSKSKKNVRLFLRKLVADFREKTAKLPMRYGKETHVIIHLLHKVTWWIASRAYRYPEITSAFTNLQFCIKKIMNPASPVLVIPNNLFVNKSDSGKKRFSDSIDKRSDSSAIRSNRFFFSTLNKCQFERSQNTAIRRKDYALILRALFVKLFVKCSYSCKLWDLALEIAW